MSPRRAKAVEGRVGDDPAAALRDLLVDTAEALLSEGPISAVTTREISRRAGVSDGVLYNYFADKNELILAALLRRYDTLATRFQAGLPKPGDATVEANLASLIRSLLALFSDAMPTIAGLMTEPLLLHKLLEAIHTQILSPQTVQRMLVEYLEAEQRLGRLRAGMDLVPVGVLLMGAITAIPLAQHLAAAPLPADIEGQIEAIVTTLMQGLKPES
jgi:AcrR family transcriptional regulator